jgi:hypothetical protein
MIDVTTCMVYAACCWTHAQMHAQPNAPPMLLQLHLSFGVLLAGAAAALQSLPTTPNVPEHIDKAFCSSWL